MPVSHAPDTRTLVFFDGVCGLCNGFVDFLVVRDRRRQLQFASLQGETARGRPDLPRDVDSVVVLHEGRILVRSTAAVTAIAALGGLWRVARLALLVPRPLRDALYAWIARHRYAWFGQRDACRLPTPAERDWFLP